MKGKAFAGALALCLALVIGVGAEGYSPQGMGLRLYAPRGWTVITADNAHEREAFLAEMGAEAAVVLASMEKDGAGALVYAPDMEARLVAGPACGVNSLWQADEKGREAIMAAALAAYPALDGDWENGLPLLTGQETLGAMTVYHRVYVTCHYGKLFGLEAVRYGSPFTDENIAQLSEMAHGLVVLGEKPLTAQPEIPRLTLPENGGMAEVRVSRDETPITLDNPYDHVVGAFVLTGTTTPNADLRYYVGGAGVARFESDDEGRFEVEIKNLARGKNAIRVQSVSEAGYGAVVFNCQYAPATAPVALAPLPETVQAAAYEVQGRALPGTEVTLLRGTRIHETATVGEDGLFALTAALDKEKAYEFTLRADHEDYKRSETEFTLKRVPDPATQVKKVNYDKLVKKPADYKDVVVRLTGAVTGMGNSPATGPYLIFDGKYMLLTDCLLGFAEGEATALARLTGGSFEGLPQARLITLE